MDLDRDCLAERMRRYLDRRLSHPELKRIAPALMRPSGGRDAEAVRDSARRSPFRAGNIVRYCHGPFDLRWRYLEPEVDLADPQRQEYVGHALIDNTWIEVRPKEPRTRSAPGRFTTVTAGGAGPAGSRFFPQYLKPPARVAPLRRPIGDGEASGVPNLSPSAFAELSAHSLGVSAVFFHALAVLHSPLYRRENAADLARGWPRIPWPIERETLLSSGSLGFRLAVELAVEWDRETYAEERRPAALDLVGRVGNTHGGTHLEREGLQAVRRSYTAGERAALGQAAEVLGPEVVDVCLDGGHCWICIPSRVWAYRLSGHQVLKRWLGERTRRHLDRPLTAHEASQAGEIARRIATILLMQPELDVNYEAVKQSGRGGDKR